MRRFWAIATLSCGFILPVFGGDMSIFDADPAHLWNRIWQIFYAVPVPAGVTVGPEELDLPVASDLGQLLRGSKHLETVALLDQFLGNRQADLVRDPLRRAVLQYDLWAVFDWVANPAADHQPERRVLQERLTRIIQRLALSTEEIRALAWYDRGEGYQSGMELLGHAGATGGYATFIGINKDQRKGVVVLSSRQGGLSPETIGWLLLRGVRLSPEIAIGLSAGTNIVGIGAALDFDAKTRTVRITKVIPDSPASESGMSPGLVVQRIDDVATADKNLTECV